MAQCIPALQTKRLILRPLRLADSTAVQRYFPRWEIVKYLSNEVPWPYPANGALMFIRDVALPAMAAGTQWHWSLRLKKEPGQLIGLINLKDKADDHRGFWMAEPWQRQGLMSEASRAVTKFWFQKLERPVLRVSKAIENRASRRISEVGNMRVIATVERDYVCGRLPAEIWEITAKEWRDWQY
jgi:RimJ/RimL family protein N-acetyltransferase